MQRKAVLPLRDAKSGNANQMKALCGKETLVKLYIRLLGAKSPFSQQNLQRDVLDRDEETARIQYLTEIAKFLGIMTTVDTEVIQGHGSYEDRTEMLRLIVYIVEATIYADNSEWRLLLVKWPEVFELEAKLSEE
ncbi:hypothetical protein AHAS_Ahas03G0276600 [Arachis hypogaea]|uniref:Uncharacterized protein n=1 Tax=Arachis hypogaea TaxID=3818 RepID=A0A445DRB0_ARAHY|nr:hypothetical protein Ahy_A03g011637 isoform A [Arachis hypogaea]RYR65707.1 hypothetical protein Ahy_A03g011637 isoform B [Arachis hypogaea]